MTVGPVGPSIIQLVSAISINPQHVAREYRFLDFMPRGSVSILKNHKLQERTYYLSIGPRYQYFSSNSRPNDRSRFYLDLIIRIRFQIL